MVEEWGLGWEIGYSSDWGRIFFVRREALWVVNLVEYGASFSGGLIPRTISLPGPAADFADGYATLNDGTVWNEVGSEKPVHQLDLDGAAQVSGSSLGAPLCTLTKDRQVVCRSPEPSARIKPLASVAVLSTPFAVTDDGRGWTLGRSAETSDTQWVRDAALDHATFIRRHPNRGRNFLTVVYDDGRMACGGGGFFSENLKTVDGITDAVAGDCNLHSCAVIKNGSVHCWGKNSFGQTGTGSRTSEQTTPVPVESLERARDVMVFDNWASVYAFTVALLEDGTVAFWGRVNDGTGSGSNTYDQLTPRLIPMYAE